LHFLSSPPIFPAPKMSNLADTMNNCFSNNSELGVIAAQPAEQSNPVNITTQQPTTVNATASLSITVNDTAPPPTTVGATAQPTMTVNEGSIKSKPRKQPFVRFSLNTYHLNDIHLFFELG
jgi:hypothetical protein